MKRILIILALNALICQYSLAKMPTGRVYTNSIGMRFVRIKPGRFTMGFGDKPLPSELLTTTSYFPYGDFDEHPTHQVEITEPFWMGIFEVTNAEYEQFDSSHKKWRGRSNYSKEDNEPAIFVSWHDGVRFCQWLSKKEGMPYRLPTEAEWEYACRAGTTTPFFMGQTLPKEFSKDAGTSLTVGRTRPNRWGLHDMHGNVEEWCCDWYGPYEPTNQVNPVGRADGDFKVTRGGSHSTAPYYLRSSNRSGTLPDDRHWLIGFRVVIDEMPRTIPLPAMTQDYQRYVKQNVPHDIKKAPDPAEPYFKGPRLFVKIPKDAEGPLYGYHNHFTAITECPNGDLLAAWFTCIRERGREHAIAASRLRYGHEEWEPASPFWDAPDRNDHTHTLWHDGKGTIFHFNGLGVSSHHYTLLLRKSNDNGATWSRAHLIYPDHTSSGCSVVESVFRAQGGEIIVPSDGRGGSIISISRDEGKTWVDPGGNIRGIHAGVAQLNDRRLIAFGRRRPIDGKMPMSVSDDMGKSWEYSPCEFQPLDLGQRVALMRLRQGPLFFASFGKNVMITDASGSQRPVTGLFAAVSTDEVKTWQYKRLISDDGPPKDIETMDGHPVTMDAHNSELVGYLSVCQTADDLVHLISSQQHYTFNLKWLTTRPPAAPAPSSPKARQLPARHSLAKIYRPKGLPSMDEWKWGFRGGPKEDDVITLSPGNPPKIHTADNQQCWWRSEKADGYDAVDRKKGFSAEIKTQIIKSTLGRRGVDLELYDGFGSRYAITITDTGVYWYEGLVRGSAFLDFDQYTLVAEGLDNTDMMHTYRLAVREDRVVQIYRDEKLLGMRRYEYRTPRAPYLQFGAGHGVEALVDYIAYDLSGPSRP